MIENDIVARAHEAAKRGDEAAIEVQLDMHAGLAADTAPSVLLARRSVVVCNWLRNDNEHGRAMKLARRTIARLERMTEGNDADRVDRLYLEACLRGNVLDEKRAALALLEEAQKLAPKDPRIVADVNRLSRALAQFGR